MALTPNIILHKGQILVTINYSTVGTTSQTSDFSFGYVEMIYSGCDFVVTGQTVLFPKSLARQILYGSTMFFIVHESYVLFDEQLPP